MVVTEIDGEALLPAYDVNGSLLSLVNATDGTLAADYEYDPFGTTLKAVGPHAQTNPWRFSTKYTDNATGLVYYGFRYYNPQAGRWLNRDPLGVADAPNEYGFVSSEPVSRMDYLGLLTIEDYGILLQATQMEQAALLDRALSAIRNNPYSGFKGFMYDLSAKATWTNKAQQLARKSECYKAKVEEMMFMSMLMNILEAGADMYSPGVDTLYEYSDPYGLNDQSSDYVALRRKLLGLNIALTAGGVASIAEDAILRAAVKKKLSQELLTERIARNAASNVPGHVAEAEVALRMRDIVSGFNTVIINPAMGKRFAEMDVVVGGRVIIEVGVGKTVGDKKKQVGRLMHRIANPKALEVVAYFPNVKPNSLKNFIEETGVKAFTDLDALEAYLRCQCAK